ncbi:MAG TPA: hypothetical protein VGR18_11960 [Rubrobacter sp.]|nr:hypothetical protein [Rubrobacter sp.]
MVLRDAGVDYSDERAVAALGAPSVVEAGLGQVVLLVVSRVVGGIRANVVVVDGGHGGLVLEFLLGCHERGLRGGLRTPGLICLGHLHDLQVRLPEVASHPNVDRAGRGGLGRRSCGVLVRDDEPVGDVRARSYLVVDVETPPLLDLAAGGGGRQK